MWEALELSEKESEKLERPSLTYWQDSWRRLRQNKVAIVSLAVIIIITLGAIFIPMFYPIDDTVQFLEFYNTPPILNIYDIGDGDYIYINLDYKVLKVKRDGTLLGNAEMTVDDIMEMVYEFNVNGKTITINYGDYFNKKVEYNTLVKRSRRDSSIDLSKAKKELNNTPKFSIFLDGEKMNCQKIRVRNKKFLLGTDGLGRDLFIRIVYGARISLTVGIVAAILNFVIGVIYGGIAGYMGGRVDNIMMRIVDTISAIPMMLYVILLSVAFNDSGLITIIFALALTHWVGMARIVRGQIFSLKEQEFVLAAQALGSSAKRILSRHLVPNIMGPIMISVTMRIPAAIFTESFLSFIGLGVSAPKASWGSLCNDALNTFLTSFYQLLYPALAISITILAFNLLGDGLRDALDPKLRK